MSGYFRVPETNRFTFKLVAENFGAKMKIDARTVIDAFFPQSNIDSVVEQYLKKDVVHTMELEFYAPRAVNNSLHILWHASNDTTFKTFDSLFFSLNGNYRPIFLKFVW